MPAATRTEIWERAGRSADGVPCMMAVDELVDAARAAMLPNFRNEHPAARYLSEQIDL